MSGFHTLDTEGHPVTWDRELGAWVHDQPAHVGHAAPEPELRFAIDATCPGCGFPEIGYAPGRGVFTCSRCEHEQDKRPAA